MTHHNCRLDDYTSSSLFGPLEVDVVHDDPGGSGRTVVLNLAGTGFVDLDGLRLLIQAAGWAAARDASLYVAGCSTSLLRLLHLSDLFDGINLVPSGQT